MKIICILQELFNSPIISSVVGGLISGGLLLRYGPGVLDEYNRPQLKLIESQTREAKIPFTIKKGENETRYYQLVLRNNGNKSITGKWYWSLLVPKELDPLLVSGGEVNNKFVKSNEIFPPQKIVEIDTNLGWCLFNSSTSDLPLYKGRGTNFPWVLQITVSDEKERTLNLYYRLATELGSFPKGSEELDQFDTKDLEKLHAEGKLGRLEVIIRKTN